MTFIRTTAAAAFTALAACSAQAMEAMQWDPRHDMAAASAVNEAALAPMSWRVGRSEAAQFRDGVARDTISTRASVREDLKRARTRHLLADTGEAGASDRVIARRSTFVQSGHDVELAQDPRLQASADPIAALAESLR